MVIAPAQLLSALDVFYGSGRAGVPTLRGPYDDFAAALLALALVEDPKLDDQAVGDVAVGGSYGLWQVNRPSWPHLAWPAPSFPGQVVWIRPIVEAYLLEDNGVLPRWWRHGHAGASADDEDLRRERIFYAQYDRYRRTDANAPVIVPAAPPGGGGAGAIFSPAAPTPEVPMSSIPAVTAPAPSSTLKEKLHEIRLAADKVRATVDQVATVVTSIPFVGAMLGAYVRGIVLVVDGLDSTIDALDNAL